jgi:hypothetical protein
MDDAGAQKEATALERELTSAGFGERAAIAAGGGHAGIVEAKQECVDPAAGRHFAAGDQTGNGPARNAARGQGTHGRFAQHHRSHLYLSAFGSLPSLFGT